MTSERPEPSPFEEAVAGHEPIAAQPSAHDRQRLADMREWLAGLSDQLPAKWVQLPDIGLYMDQVVTYIDRQLALHRSSAKEHVVTSAMVNNYIKDGLLPRAELKKYAPTHLALLTMIGALKQVLSMQDLQILLNGGAGRSVPGMYEHFLKQLEDSIIETADAVGGELQDLSAPDSPAGGREPLPDPGVAADHRLASLRRIALDLAIEARVRVLIAEQLLAAVAAAERDAQGRKAAEEREARDKKAAAASTEKVGRRK